MSAASPSLDRLYDLLADRATEGLAHEHEGELRDLLGSFPEADADSVDRAAAAVYLACESAHASAMPANVRDKLNRVGADWAAGVASRPRSRSSATDSSEAPYPVVYRYATPPVAWLGWVAAAACLIGSAVVLTSRPRPTPAPAPVVGALPIDLEAMRNRPTVLRAAFAPGPDETGKGVTGEMLWDDAEQRGYMVFKGLAALDPAKNCYQLWIFDPARDERYPVHGGVFQADAGTGEVVVPVRSRLAVEKPNLFVVTVEPPGGVWVSDRSRIAAVAKRG